MNTLLFVDDALDRAHHLRRDPDHLEQLRRTPDSMVVVQWRDLMLLRDGRALTATGAEAARLFDLAEEMIFLGKCRERAVFALDVSGLSPMPDGAPPPWENNGYWGELRAAAPALPAEDGVLLSAARALVNWHRSARFCGRCGSPTQSREGGHMRACLDQSCGAQHYPRTDCAVIMLVENGDDILLHRQPAWPAGMWSVLAGFVEPGETLEQAVCREVMEETGIIADQVRYAGSQPWPFPSSLMAGFTARAIGGELRPDPHELDDARWFSRDQVKTLFSDDHRNKDGAGPYLARPGSIARILIDAWLKQ